MHALLIQSLSQSLRYVDVDHRITGRKFAVPEKFEIDNSVNASTLPGVGLTSAWVLSLNMAEGIETALASLLSFPLRSPPCLSLA